MLLGSEAVCPRYTDDPRLVGESFAVGGMLLARLTTLLPSLLVPRSIPVTADDRRSKSAGPKFLAGMWWLLPKHRVIPLPVSGSGTHSGRNGKEIPTEAASDPERCHPRTCWLPLMFIYAQRRDVWSRYTESRVNG